MLKFRPRRTVHNVATEKESNLHKEGKKKIHQYSKQQPQRNYSQADTFTRSYANSMLAQRTNLAA